MSLQIAALHAVEILDSRARPTLAVTLETADGTRVRAGVLRRVHRHPRGRRTP